MGQSVTGCIYQPCGGNQEFKLLLTLSDYVCHDVGLIVKPFFLVTGQVENTMRKTQASDRAKWRHSMSFLPQGISLSEQNKRRKWCGIMGVAVLIVKQPPLLMEISLMWLGQKCSQVKWRSKVVFNHHLRLLSLTPVSDTQSKETHCCFEHKYGIPWVWILLETFRMTEVRMSARRNKNTDRLSGHF